MTVLDYLRLLRKHVAFVVIVTMLGALAAGAYAYTMLRDTYRASTTLYVLISQDYSEEAAYNLLSNNFSVSAQISNDVSQLISSDRVRSQAAELLGRSSLSGYSISVMSGDEDSRILRVYVTGYDSVGVADVANAIGEVSSELARDIMGVRSINVIDLATEPRSPSGPNRIRYVVLGAIGGLGLPVVGICLAGALDKKVRDGRTVENISGFPLLGLIPRLAVTDGHAKKKTNKHVATIGDIQDAARRLLANLLFFKEGSRPCSVVVCSPAADEGKSTVAFLLAQAMARGGSNTLLVECNLRDPALADLLDVHARKGMIGLTTGETVVLDSVSKTRQKNLYLLDAELRITNPTEFIASTAFADMMNALEKRFDYVVIDTAPLNAYADASLLASQADAVLLVVREGHSTKADLRAATKQLRRAHVEHVGIVLNCASPLPGVTQFSSVDAKQAEREQSVVSLSLHGDREDARV